MIDLAEQARRNGEDHSVRRDFLAACEPQRHAAAVCRRQRDQPAAGLDPVGMGLGQRIGDPLRAARDDVALVAGAERFVGLAIDRRQVEDQLERARLAGLGAVFGADRLLEQAAHRRVAE